MLCNLLVVCKYHCVLVYVDASLFVLFILLLVIVNFRAMFCCGTLLLDSSLDISILVFEMGFVYIHYSDHSHSRHFLCKG